jgi:DNA-binding response OmpR family regulator
MSNDLPNDHALPTAATVDLPSADATVLVVDDDQDLADTYAVWLREHVEVHVAYSGADALDVLETESVDVVLLDRRMPSMSGDDVLATMRERGHDQRAAMVTAVDPTLDAVEMPFDDYLVKPVRQDALESTVESLLSLAERSDAFQTYFALESTLDVLESAPEYRTLDDSGALAALRDRVAAERARALARLEAGPRRADADCPRRPTATG